MAVSFPPANAGGYPAKKAFDIAFSLALLVISAPLLLLIAVLVRATSRGPAVFRQVRMGYRHQPFVIYKFRTMADGSGKERDLVRKGDPRVTPVGKFLRATHMDELPQLVNVLMGDMSVVGPRPDSWDSANMYVDRYLQYAWAAYFAKPGLTGPSQIHGREKILRRGRGWEAGINRRYAERQTFERDLAIIFFTFPRILKFGGV